MQVISFYFSKAGTTLSWKLIFGKFGSFYHSHACALTFQCCLCLYKINWAVEVSVKPLHWFSSFYVWFSVVLEDHITHKFYLTWSLMHHILRKLCYSICIIFFPLTIHTYSCVPQAWGEKICWSKFWWDKWLMGYCKGSRCTSWAVS
jgi:hypothetical protein